MRKPRTARPGGGRLTGPAGQRKITCRISRRGTSHAGRGRPVRYSPTARQLYRGVPRRRPGLRRGPASHRFQDRHSARGADRPRLSLLRLRHQEAHPVRAGQPRQDLRGRRLLARPHRQGAGLPRRPQRIQRLRRGLEGIFQRPAGAHDGRHQRPAGQGFDDRNRPDRLCPGRGRVHRGDLGCAAAARQLHRGLPGRRAGLCRRPTAERLQDRHPARGADRSRLSLLRLRHQEAHPLRARQPRQDLRGGGLFARPHRQGAGLPRGPARIRRLRRGLERVFQDPAGADHGGHDGAAGQGFDDRDRPDRLRPGRDRMHRRAVRQPAAARQLHRGLSAGGFRLRRRPGAERLRHRNSGRGAGPIPPFPITAPTSRSARAMFSTTWRAPSRPPAARSTT